MNAAALPTLPGLARVTHLVTNDQPSAMERRAREIWDFCEGWNPERLPVALAFLPVSDPEMLIEMLLEMRDYMNDRREFERRVQDLRSVH